MLITTNLAIPGGVMKRVISIIGLAILFASTVNAAQVFGTVREDGRPLNGVRFEVFCRDGTYTGVTDNDGAYNLTVGRGRCTFRLYYKNQTPSYEVYSYDNPLRYDFTVVTQENGNYLLKRR